MLGARRARRPRPTPRPPRHAEALAPADRVLLRAGRRRRVDHLSAIAVGIGPGLFTGLRVGVTTAKVMAQALRVPDDPDPEPRPARVPAAARRAGSSSRRSTPAAASSSTRVYRTGARRRAAGVATTRSARPTTLRRPSSKRAARRPAVRRRRAALRRRVRRASIGVELAGTAHAAPSLAALVELAAAPLEREEFARPADVLPLVPAQERRRDRLGPAAARVSGRPPRRPLEPLDVHIVPMRRRHLRSVLRIEQPGVPAAVDARRCS